MIKGVDVSSHNGEIDWAAAKEGGVSFAVIRSSFGQSRRDKRFEENLRGCAENEIPFGFYHYSYALTPAEAAKEAEFFLKTVGGEKPALPLFFDFEEKEQRALPLETQLEIIETFCKKVAAAGFKAGFYGSKSYFEILKKAAPEMFTKYFVWVAQWNFQNTFSGRFDLWQNSSAGKIPGITGPVDTDVFYGDFLGGDCAALKERVRELEERLSEIGKIAAQK